MSYRNDQIRRLFVTAISLVMAASMLGVLPISAFGDVAEMVNEAAVPASVGPDSMQDHQFQLMIRVPEGGATFMVPTSSYLNGSYDGKPYDWLIDWGDGSETVEAGVSAQDSGIPHYYAASGEYMITIKPNGSIEAWLAAFGFAFSSDEAESLASKPMVIGVPSPLTPQMTRTTDQIAGTATPPSYEWAWTFSWCTNLYLAPSFEGWEGITLAGDRFAYHMFAFNLSLVSLPHGYNLPQDFISVGDSFAYFMFGDCQNLIELSGDLTLPQSITTAGDSFAASMFSYCLRLSSLSYYFNLPQGLVTVGDGFASGMFDSCMSLVGLPDGFCFPQGITDANNGFADAMFMRCYNLVSLPAGFNLPQNLQTAGDDFACMMFLDCIRLSSLPVGFNLPQKLTSVGRFFVIAMFDGCTRLEGLPVGFNFPQELATAGDAFASGMFHSAGSSAFQINDELCLPPLLPSDSPRAFDNTFQLSANAPTQNRTAASIIGSCPLPDSRRYTFDSHFTDIDFIHVNWGGELNKPPVGARGSGDLNGDGFVTMDEVLQTAKASMENIGLSLEQLLAIDMDYDGYITMADVIMVYQLAIL